MSAQFVIFGNPPRALMHGTWILVVQAECVLIAKMSEHAFDATKANQKENSQKMRGPTQMVAYAKRACVQSSWSACGAGKQNLDQNSR